MTLPEDTIIYRIKPRKGFPYHITTVARRVGERLVNRGTATCSPQDQFNRKRGVQIALGRMLALEGGRKTAYNLNCMSGIDRPMTETEKAIFTKRDENARLRSQKIQTKPETSHDATALHI